MLTIKTLEDIEEAEKDNFLADVLAKELKQYFKELAESLTGETDTWQSYNLEQDGPILVMEPGVDDPTDIKEFGMTKEYGGLFCAPIEFTSKVKLEEKEFFKTVLVLDNSFCLVIYSEVGKFGEELDAYLTEYLGD